LKKRERARNVSLGAVTCSQFFKSTWIQTELILFCTTKHILMIVVCKNYNHDLRTSVNQT